MIHKNLFGALALTALTLTAPVAAKAAPQHNRPRIVVTMMVDQMTWDYLYRYQARFVEGGFKRLLTQGFNCENTRIKLHPPPIPLSATAPSTPVVSPRSTVSQGMTSSRMATPSTARRTRR